MDFDSVPEDLSLCEPHWWSKATAGELPPGEGSLHEARLVGVGDNYCWIDENLAEIVFFMWKLGIKTESTCHNLYEADDEVFTMQLDSGPKEYVRPKICFINFDASVEAPFRESFFTLSDISDHLIILFRRDNCSRISER